MQAKNDISDELRSLSALVEGIGRQMPYELPEGYFEGLPPLILGKVLDRIARMAIHDEPIVGLSKSLTFSVPEGYFDNLASQVLDRIKAGSISKDFSGKDFPGKDSLRKDLFGDGVQEELARISPIVSRITRENPYRLPEGYFAEVSPILSVLKDKTTYVVPEGYFDYLPAAATEKVIHEGVREVFQQAVPAMAATSDEGSAKGGARVVAIGSKGKVVKGHWWKYAGVAAAACLILVFSWPQLHTRFSNISGGKSDEGQHVGTVDLASSMSQSLHKVSDQEILNYLDDQNSILAEPVSNNTATLDMNDSDIKTLLGDVPDGELQQYMEEHGRANDIATN
jgi:hypothetical protein